ncbi:MAG: tRNA lysidine(34) synthetase TilS [Acidobacteria bacterium]|nr:tRNA lysidine(34) synthetase TilS [Acidobacteriota bacterium]
MLDRVRETIRKHHMFSHGEPLAVAVSGGRDSVCLLDVLCELGYRPLVLHVNHGLRPEAAAEEQFVRDLAAGRGLECRVQLAKLADGNQEQAARQARHLFFAQFPKVATGHTLSDQAETVLYRLLRGAGSTGLRGVLPVTEHGRIVRPLIEISRLDIDTWMAARQLPYCDDASNAELRFDRNRIRHQLLPQLTEQWNEALPHVLAHTALLAAEDEAFFEVQVATVWSTLSRWEHGALILDCQPLAEMPDALARRVVRHAISQVKGNLRSIDFTHVEQILALTRLTEGHGRVQVPGVDVMRSFEWLNLAPERRAADEPRNWSVAIDAPGEWEVPPGITVRIAGYNRGSSGKSLILRNWRPGDAIRLAGSQEEVKIKQLFQERRIPLWRRRNWPILELSGEIIWAGAFGGISLLEFDVCIVRESS